MVMNPTLEGWMPDVAGIVSVPRRDDCRRLRGRRQGAGNSFFGLPSCPSAPTSNRSKTPVLLAQAIG